MDGALLELINNTYFQNKNKNPFQTVQEMVSKKNCKILDMCTSTGTNVISMGRHKLDSELIGANVKSRQLMQIKHQVKRSGLKNIKIHYIKKDKLPYEDNSFDYITISFALSEKSEEERVELLEEAKRLIKKNGRIIICEWEEPTSLYKKLLFLPVRLVMTKEQDKFVHKDCKRYLKQHGLAAIKVRHCAFSKVLFCAKSSMIR